MDKNGIECSLRDAFDADQPAAGVEQHDLKILNFVGAILFAKQVGNAFRIVQRWRFNADFLGHAARQREGAFQCDGFIASNAFDLAEIGNPSPGKIVERFKFPEQLFGNLDCGNAFQAGAQQNGDQFRILKRVSPILNQPFAWTFITGHVLDA
jgi:hypothetical protein